MINDIQEKLERLAELQSQIDLVNLHFNELHRLIIPSEIQVKLDEIEVERKTTLETAQEGATKLESEIRSGILEYGMTVKGNHLQAVWMKGRISWDTKALDGYAAAHPEITPFRKVGEPSVSIRKV